MVARPPSRQAIQQGSGTRPLNEVIDIANSGQGVGNLNKAEWAMVRDNPGYTTPSAAAAQQQGQGTDEDTDDESTVVETKTVDPTQAYYDMLESRRVNNAIQVAKSLLTQYNLMSLYDKMVGYIKEGYEPDTIMLLLRTTPEYKQRFPAMEALAQKGRAISEAEYIEYERKASQLEQMYGLPEGMIQNNVTSLLTNEVSADELQNRVVLASAASVTAPDDLKQTLKNFYGIDQGGLAAYFLDPAIATPLLEKQYATSVIGTEAMRQDVNIGVQIAENLQNLGVTQEQAREGFGRVKRFETFTQGRGDTVSQQNLISGTFGDEQAAQQVERAQRARIGRFEGGGQFVSTQEGVGGLGSSAT